MHSGYPLVGFTGQRSRSLAFAAACALQQRGEMAGLFPKRIKVGWGAEK